MPVLEGIRVIDVTMWAFVPSAGGVLAHWGADVIKVENPRSCDPMRTFGGTIEPDGASWMFKHYNRGKRSIALDLAAEDGRDVLYRLVDEADVFLTSFLPATRKRLGFDIEEIRARNPRIVYAKGTGQGPLGPEAEKGGYDGATFWWRGGLADATARATSSPWPPGMIGHGDGLSGLTLAGGVCAALLHRERTGEGQVVDGSLLGTAMWFLGPAIVTSKIGETFGALGPREDREPLMNSYRTSDGRFVMVNSMGGDEDWADLCVYLGHPELATDSRFSPSAARTEHRTEAVRLLDSIFGQRTLAEWKTALAGTRAVWAPDQTARELHDDPQTTANGFIRDMKFQHADPLALVMPPILFDQDVYDPVRAPDFGEHSAEILKEVGYSEMDITRLRQAGVVA